MSPASSACGVPPKPRAPRRRQRDSMNVDRSAPVAGIGGSAPDVTTPLDDDVAYTLGDLIASHLKKRVGFAPKQDNLEISSRATQHTKYPGIRTEVVLSHQRRPDY